MVHWILPGQNGICSCQERAGGWQSEAHILHRARPYDFSAVGPDTEAQQIPHIHLCLCENYTDGEHWQLASVRGRPGIRQPAPHSFLSHGVRQRTGASCVCAGEVEGGLQQRREQRAKVLSKRTPNGTLQSFATLSHHLFLPNR